jgi:hypothetical protein
MTLKEEFSLQRLYFCLRRDMKPNSRSSFVILGAAAGFLLIISALDILVGDASADFHQGIFYPILIVGGFVFTSGIFKEMHGKGTNLPYLMLPASALEKVISRLLLVSLGWVLFSIVWYTLYSALSEGINMILFGKSHPVFHPFNGDVWKAAAHYTVMQSFFLLGAVFFRKLHFFKTLLTLAAFTILASLFAMLMMRIVFAGYVEGSLFIDRGEGFDASMHILGRQMEELGRTFLPLLKILYWMVFPLFSWVLVYIRFKEVEIKDGV